MLRLRIGFGNPNGVNQEQAGADDKKAVGEIEVRPRIEVWHTFEAEENPVADVIANVLGMTGGEAPADAVVEVAEDAAGDQAQGGSQPAVAAPPPGKQPCDDQSEEKKRKSGEPEASPLPHPEQSSTVGRRLDPKNLSDPVVPFLSEIQFFKFRVKIVFKGPAFRG